MYCPECGASVETRAAFCPYCGVRLLAPPQAPAAVSVPGRDAKPRLSPARRRRVLARSILVAAVVLLLDVLVSSLVLSLVGEGAQSMLVQESVVSVVGALVAAVGVRVLGGGELLRWKPASVLAALGEGWWLLASACLMCAYDLAALVLTDQFALSPTWWASLAATLVMCLGVGVFEECLFRGILLGGLVAAWAERPRGLLRASVVASVLFGLAHIEWWSLDFTDPLQDVQALLKICQMAEMGLFLGAVVVSQRDLLGAAALHALNNFSLLAVTIGLQGADFDVAYVVSGREEALAAIAVYLIFCACYLPLVLRAVRLLKRAGQRDDAASLFDR